jgi:hypothetical protein
MPAQPAPHPASLPATKWSRGVLRAFALESPTIWETCIRREREIRFPDILENAVQRNKNAVQRLIVRSIFPG